MKRFITAMLFSLTVIVCEQQTLFAPHFTTFDGLTAANPRDTTNSLVPVAGVNMSIPLAGSSENGFVRYPPLVKPKHDSPSFVTSNVDLVFDCRPNIMDPDNCPDVVDPSGYNGDAPFGVSDRYVGDQDPGAGLWSCHFD
jgi:hypothetical protein